MGVGTADVRGCLATDQGIRMRQEGGRLRDDSGLGLVELLVSLTVLAIVMSALASVMMGTLRATQVSDQRTIATNLAQAELEKVRALPFSRLTVGGRSAPYAVDTNNGVYEVVRETTWVSFGASTDPCAQPEGSDTRALVRVDVEVSPQRDPSQIVRSSTTVARPPVAAAGSSTTGVLAVRVIDGQSPSAGVAGVPVSVIGLTPGAGNGLQTTPHSGCLLFVGMPAGNYTVKVHRPGYIGDGIGGDQTTLEVPASVVSNEHRSVDVLYAKAASLVVGGTGVDGQEVVLPEQLPVTLLREGGTRYELAQTPVPGLWPGDWELYAGTCPGADPIAWNGSRQARIRLTPGATASAAAVLGSVRLDLQPTELLPLVGPFTIGATEAEGACPNGGGSLQFLDVLAPGTGEAATAVELGLPYGRWSLTVADASGHIATTGVIQVDPTAPHPVEVPLTWTVMP